MDTSPEDEAEEPEANGPVAVLVDVPGFEFELKILVITVSENEVNVVEASVTVDTAIEVVNVVVPAPPPSPDPELGRFVEEGVFVFVDHVKEVSECDCGLGGIDVEPSEVSVVHQSSWNGKSLGFIGVFILVSCGIKSRKSGIAEGDRLA